MRTLIALTSLAATLALVSCGGDDETTSAAGPTGTSGAQGATAGAEMTAKEFIDASIPDEVAAVQEAAEATPQCEGANTNAGSDFQVQVAIDAAQADPDTPLAEIVAGAC
jgi:hypothetical protein